MKRAKFLFNIPDVKLYPVRPSLLYSARPPIQSGIIDGQHKGDVEDESRINILFWSS